ncbi:MAG TPA: hypothetical protein EYM37_03815 [Methylophaga aminisulfidivorans]|uniref:hypothetical protein n=1 Tax=Methylophaga TaxID=40222 RepID=UPI001753AF33|nr:MULTISPECIES: hypothetical protein [Methylophaga]HIC47622.1 hypothetical protein [Methylophaga sp.]HIM39047.1 hypothetical protein [Methylophaga aminisulfidivorans]
MTNYTIQRWLPLLFLVSLILQTSLVMAKTGTGLEIDNPQQVYVVYTVEPDGVDQGEFEAIIDNQLSQANIQQSPRDDAQLFLRVEEHAGEYLLYLDFNRTMQYSVDGKSYNKDGFVWGRYVKDIADIDELNEDVEFLINEFIEEYSKANKL